MLYVYTGADTIAVRKAAHTFLETYEAKGANVDHIDSVHCSAEALRDRIGAQSLFGTTALPEVTLIDTPSERVDAFDAVQSLLPEIAESPNVFVLIEEKLLAAQLKPLRQHATEFHEVKGDAPSERFNGFAFADAFARRDKKTLWILLVRAKSAGLSAEEIVGTLFWQVKTMRLASVTNNASEAGMKDFPYNKAKRALVKFKDGELDELSQSLITFYHQSRLGMRDMDIALERWILDI